MMSYAVDVPRKVQKQLARLPENVRERMVNALLALGDEPRPEGCRKLTNREGYQMKIGNYRAIYLINDTEQKVAVVRVAHRRDVYR